MLRRFAETLYFAALTLWVGGLWTIGYVVAPTLFSTLADRQLKADALPREVMESVLRDRFVTWHGISSILYLMQSLLGLWLVVWSNRGLR